MEWTINTGRTSGSNHGRNGHDNISLLPLLLRSTELLESSTKDTRFNDILGGMDEYDQGEVEIAKALSLSQMEFEKQQHLIIEKKKMETVIEEDEQLANATQLSLVMCSSLTNDTGHASSSKAASSLFEASASKIICVGCNTEIRRSECSLDLNGMVFHAKCLLCHACKQLIKDVKLCIMVGNRPYHTSCPRNKCHPKCYVCNNFIPDIDKVVEFGVHPFWEQNYCPSHENDGTSKCVSCERLQPKEWDCILLKDGRILCPDCSNFMIMDTDDCQPLFREIQQFFASLQMKLNQEIPLLLVEREALNDAMEEEKNGHHLLSETRGLCVSEEQTIPMIQKKEYTGKHSILDMLTQPRRLVRTCEVTAILILYGLPRLLTGSTLAHEMMHAWLRLEGYPDLKPEIEEGICQVIAHMWLKSQMNVEESEAPPMAGSSSSSLQPPCSNKREQMSKIEKRLGECFMHQIEQDTSVAYGDGFRVGEQAVSHYGLKETLDHIKLTQTFPV